MTSHDSAAEPTDAFVADVFDRDCPSRGIMATVSGKWGVLAIVALSESPMRFNALRRKVTGISEKMLSQTLQHLERDGIVHREVRAAIPPHVEYRLTVLGERVAKKLAGLVDLLEASMDEVIAARQDYDSRPE